MDDTFDWNMVALKDDQRIKVLQDLLFIGLPPHEIVKVIAYLLADLGWTEDDIQFYLDLAQARIDAERS